MLTATFVAVGMTALFIREVGVNPYSISIYSFFFFHFYLILKIITDVHLPSCLDGTIHWTARHPIDRSCSVYLRWWPCIEY